MECTMKMIIVLTSLLLLFYSCTEQVLDPNMNEDSSPTKGIMKLSLDMTLFFTNK